MTTCYMCDSPASSNEHAPPKCIFPEQKDTPSGNNYRKNLITVPSCNAHNTARSKDDEYLLHALAASITSNDVGLNQFLTKVRRALERNPKLVSSLPIGETPSFNYVTESGQLDEAFPVIADGERIDRVITSCARALYLFETGKKFVGATKAIAPFMSYLDPSVDQAVITALGYAKDFLKLAPAKGENQDVFYYKFAEGAGTAVLLLCFYGRTEFLVHLDKR